MGAAHVPRVRDAGTSPAVGREKESYELAAYFLARHTATDAWEKRGQRGYVFIISTCPRLTLG